MDLRCLRIRSTHTQSDILYEISDVDRSDVGIAAAKAPVPAEEIHSAYQSINVKICPESATRAAETAKPIEQYERICLLVLSDSSYQ